MFIVATILFSILITVFSTSKLEINGIPVKYAISLLTFSCFLSLNNCKHGKLLQNVLITICGVVYVWLEQVNAVIIIYFQMLSVQ